MLESKKKRFRLGSTMQKVLLLLEAGIALSLTANPRASFRILRGVSKEWQRLNRKALKVAIKNLYQSKLIYIEEKEDGTVKLTLSDEGKQKALQYNPDSIQIKKMTKWDGLWRLVMFDIPESKKQGRDALASKLKRLGFYPLQKSVFIHPYECKDEIDFIVELFELRPYVRFLRVKDIDVALDLKHRFRLA